MIEMTKKIPAAALILVFVLQLYVIISMIVSQEKIIAEGTEYRFRVGLLDPVDPFRGRYVMLNIDPSNISLDDDRCGTIQSGAWLKIELKKDSLGFVKWGRILEDSELPALDFLKVKTKYLVKHADDSCDIRLDLPFSEYYMQEFKAPEAEQLMWSRDSLSANDIWLSVNITDGIAVPTGLFIKGRKIEDLLSGNR